MYTVFRAVKSDSSLIFLNEVIKEFKKIDRTISINLRKAGDGLSCDVSTAELWIDHQKSIISFLDFYLSLILMLKEKNYSVTIDTAVDKDDILLQSYGLFLHYDSDLIKKMSLSGIDYEMSIYIGD